MIVLSANRLSEDFLGAAAVQNIRAILRALIPDKQIKGRSTSGLIMKLNEQDLEVTPGEFRRAMWTLMDDGYKGSYHICLASLRPLMENEPAAKLNRAYDQWRALTQNAQTISTGEALDAVLRDGGEDLDVLYIGEAEAELYDQEKTFEEERDGALYTFKAYRHISVPVLSKITVGLNEPYATITTRAIHQGVTPTTEANGIRDYLTDFLQVPFPPLGGIAEGIRALWGTRIEPRKYDVEEPDGTRINLACAPGARNPSTQQVEQALQAWDFKKGNLMFDATVPFRVDVGRALFSFGAKVAREDADNVISEIIAAAP